MDNNLVETLILTGPEVASLLDPGDCAEAVERAFRMHGLGEVPDPAVAGVHVHGGGFHMKAGVLGADSPYFVAKTNANFPANPERGLPTIQGTIVLHDVHDGRVLALMDSIQISAIRTGAATAVAARHLARPGSRVVAIIGCGVQGRVQLRALEPGFGVLRVFLWDHNRDAAGELAAEFADRDWEINVVETVRDATSDADIVVTCTPSTEFLLGAEDVMPGSFVAGVGVDNPLKRELSPDLLSKSKVVADILDQCAAIGDIHHAIDHGAISRSDVHAELGKVVAGLAAGREDDHETIVFDSTGSAIQDVAAASLVYKAARESGVGRFIQFN